MKTIKATIALVITVFLMSCVQQTHQKNITFKVDMRHIENAENVGLRGSFTKNPWTETILLTDANNDGIFEHTISQKTAINQIQFKFVNNNNDYELRGLDNRVIDFEHKPETLTYKAVFNDPSSIEIVKD